MTETTARTKATSRVGPFWDAIAGRAPIPRAATTLGFEFVDVDVDVDVDAGRIEVAFAATDDFTTPMGDVLGGFLAAMLYDTVGPCLLATLAPDEFIETLDLRSSFLRPAFTGRITGRGRIVHREGDTAFLDASLHDPAGHTIATATAIIRVVTVTARKARLGR